MLAHRRSSRLWPYAAATAAGMVVIIAALLITRTDTHAGPGGCVSVEVSSSTEKDKLLADLADRYNDAGKRFGGRCARITVHGLTSGASMAALAGGWANSQPKASEPQVWLPSSSLWIQQLTLRGKGAFTPAPGGYTSIANSPVVVAMPKDKAKVMQERGLLGWGEILGMPGGGNWAALGHPEWGRFTFGSADPNLSTSGLGAAIASYYAAVHRISDLTEEDVNSPNATQFVRRIQANVSHYSPDPVYLLKDLLIDQAEGAAQGVDFSAVVIQEELLYQYNHGDLDPYSNGAKVKASAPLVAVYPQEGTVFFDHPYVVLPSANAEQKRVAQDFLDFLLSRPAQDRFAELGFRDHDRKASKNIVDVVGAREPQGYAPFGTPNPAVVSAILQRWGTLRKKANILVIVDASGSMKNTIGNQTRFQVATTAAEKAIGLLNTEDQVALWSFSDSAGRHASAGKPYREEVGLSPLDQAAFATRLKSINTEGGTALYATIRDGYRYMREHYDPSRINAVVVLTDGRNEDTDNDLDRLLRDVTPGDPTSPVKIFAIAFDKDSALDPLTQIARASSGQAFDARDPAKIDESLVQVLSAF